LIPTVFRMSQTKMSVVDCLDGLEMRAAVLKSCCQSGWYTGALRCRTDRENARSAFRSRDVGRPHAAATMGRANELMLVRLDWAAGPWLCMTARISSTASAIP
jgi:hypothetical protein